MFGTLHSVLCARPPSPFEAGVRGRPRGRIDTHAAPVCRAAFGLKHSDTKGLVLRESYRLRATEDKDRGQPNIADLAQTLQDALAKEDYSQAAMLRDKIDELTKKDPVMQLQQRLKQAIADESYKLAADLRDELKALRPPEPEILPGVISDTTTEGVRVQIRSQYTGRRFGRGTQYYMFEYEVTITNNTLETVRLKSRHWDIADSNGSKESVEGEGVVGKTFELKPNESFTYESEFPLRTPRGSLKGWYRFARLDPLLKHYESSYFQVTASEIVLDAGEHRTA